ncbi:Hypothetical protein, putative [Bodo saltans]|uniref:Uncharacterized protein n=1 Tax=Bodo saltans TaxID=75058 RepID=A0A0S4KHG1_BODSA|nr:Hypothetical protein, putative [Bodo saltans]|eukprot:CUI11065.1 Hypothetical protein, putative [Bodo saltans]
MQQQQQLQQTNVDQCIRWLTLAMQPMDLGTYCTTVASIDQLRHAQLTAWKRDVASNFMAALKQSLKPHMSVNPRKVLIVLAISDFTRFKAVYDASGD